MSGPVADHPLSTGFAPAWASEWGQDRYGVFAAFRVGSVCHQMRWIRPGEFLQGSPEGEFGRGDGERQRLVRLTRGFWLAETVCTEGLWKEVMGELPGEELGLEYPVVSVDHGQVQKFIARCGEMIPGLELRLPTEAEWEYACRAGTTTTYWFGDEPDPEVMNFDPDGGRPPGSRSEYLWAAHAKTRNPWGLSHVHGNVWEWCSDWYGYDGPSAIEDPEGPQQGSRRVVRGGSWIYHARYCRSAQRIAYLPGHASGYLGVRLARGP